MRDSAAIQRRLVHFLTIALGAATEARRLLDLTVRLGLMAANDVEDKPDASDELVRSLRKMIPSLTVSRWNSRP